MELLVKEACNAAVVPLRRGTIGKRAFDKAIEAALRLAAANVKMYPQGELMREAVAVASQTGLAVYDALYLALARELGLPLLSLDVGQADAARRLGLRAITSQ